MIYRRFRPNQLRGTLTVPVAMIRFCRKPYVFQVVGVGIYYLIYLYFQSASQSHHSPREADVLKLYQDIVYYGSLQRAGCVMRARLLEEVLY